MKHVYEWKESTWVTGQTDSGFSVTCSNLRSEKCVIKGRYWSWKRQIQIFCEGPLAWRGAGQPGFGSALWLLSLCVWQFLAPKDFTTSIFEALLLFSCVGLVVFIAVSIFSAILCAEWVSLPAWTNGWCSRMLCKAHAPCSCLWWMMSLWPRLFQESFFADCCQHPWAGL